MTVANQEPPIEPLTDREKEVMRLYTNPFLEKEEVASRLSISVATLSWHIGNIYSKLRESERYPASFRFFQLYPDFRNLIDEYIAS